MEYSNTSSYHHSLETLWRKFLDDYDYIQQTFPKANSYSFEFWSPVVTGWNRGGALIDGLDALSTHFEDETEECLELVINREYTSRISELRDEAEGDTSDYGSPAFRFVQILENLVGE
jgi:hypothetical protein